MIYLEELAGTWIMTKKRGAAGLSRIRCSMKMLLLAIAALAVVLVPLLAPYREAMRVQARTAWAGELAQACLKKHGCDLPRQTLSVSLGANAASVCISGKGVISEGERKVRPTQVIIPYQESEDLIILLDEVGPLSKAQSRLMVSRDDLRVIEVVTAE
jgi:hypothetical protein